jgi:hypothetical protein
MADPTIPTSNSSTSGGAPVSNSGGSIKRGFDGLAKYSVSEFSYPTDLFTSAQGSPTANPNVEQSNNAYNSYIVFYINVTEESRVSKRGGEIIVGTVDRADQNTLQNGVGGGNLENFVDVATDGAAITGAALALPGSVGGASSALFGPGKASARFGRAFGELTKGIASGAAVGAATGFIQTGALSEALGIAGIRASTKINRLKTAIAMHVPQNYVVGYRVNYADEELGALFGNAAAAARGQNVSGAQAAILGLASRSDAMPALSALTRSAINPRREQLFRSVDNRRFTFEYQFAPRSEGEARNIRRIINTFKYHMHPEYLDDSSRLAYLFPSEFDIVHMFKNQESQMMNKISTCVLAEMTVNYSPNGQFSTHGDGMPTQINVQMTFIELETLTKDRFMNETELTSNPDKAMF